MKYSHHLGLIARGFSQKDLQSIGIRVAVEGYLEALIKYSPFERIDIFCFDQEEASDIYHSSPVFQNAKVAFFETNSLIERIQSGSYTLLLGLDPVYGAILTDLRNQFAPIPCPVFSLIHTLSLPQIQQAFLELQGNSNRIDAIISTSKAGKIVIQKYFEHNKKLLNSKMDYKGDFIDLPLGITDSTSSSNLKSKLGIPETGTIIGTVGRLSMLSKMEYTPSIIAFYELIHQTNRNDLYLVIAGKTENPGYLQKLKMIIKKLKLEPYVRLYLDFQPKERADLFNTFDIFLSLSDHIQETFGLTLLEAMRAGKPLVVSDWDGYRDIVSHEKTGFLIPSFALTASFKQTSFLPLIRFGDIWDKYIYQNQTTAIHIPYCIDALKKLLDPQLRSQFGKAAKQQFQTAYTWQKIIPKFWKAYLDHQIKKSTKPITRITKSPDFVSIFNHYASNQLEGHHQFKITSFGESLLYGKYPLSMLGYEGLWDEIFSVKNNILPILSTLYEWKNFQELKNLFLDNETLTINLLHALKYHLIQIKI